MFDLYGLWANHAEKEQSTHGEADLSREAKALLIDVNRQLFEWQEEIKELYEQVYVLYQEGASAFDYERLLGQINEIKDISPTLETTWRETAAQSGVSEDIFFVASTRYNH